MSSTVAVTAAGGKTGRAVVAALRSRGAEVREVRRAQMADLAAVLTGCDAVYLIAPNMYEDEPGFVRQVLDTAQASGVAHIGYHSVAAPYAPSMPHHVGKAIGEDRVRRCGMTWTILQPPPYLQNFLPALRAVPPALEVAYDPDRLFGFVDLEDVAEAAAIVLLDRGYHGGTYELGGPALITLSDLARHASSALGRDVPVVRITTQEWVEQSGSGLPDRVRDWLLAMFAYYDEHGLPAGSLALPALLGRPATSVYDALQRELTSH